jgi:hypothetical protein
MIFQTKKAAFSGSLNNVVLYKCLPAGRQVRRNGSTILILLLVSPKIYLATFTARFSRITVTFIWPG